MQNGVPSFSLLEKGASVSGKNTISRSRKRLGLSSAVSPVPASASHPAAPPDTLSSQLLFSRMTEPAKSRALKVTGNRAGVRLRL